MTDPLRRFLKPPFRADKMGGIVWSADNFHFADVRGWGQLKYQPDGEAVQDFHLQFMVDALNEKVARDAANEGEGTHTVDWATYCARLRKTVKDIVNLKRSPEAHTLSDAVELAITMVNACPPQQDAAAGKRAEQLALALNEASVLAQLQGADASAARFTGVLNLGLGALGFDDGDAAHLFEVSVTNVRRWRLGYVLPPAWRAIITVLGKALSGALAGKTEG